MNEQQRKQELYQKAREAYYNGQEIMSDTEFDVLEEELGLANTQVGANHNPSYTVKHPYIMGSLSKVQIHDDSWGIYYPEVMKYIQRHNHNRMVIVSPKYDGCSFEMYFYRSYKVELKASTRGDGYWGRDITPLIKYLVKPIMDIPKKFSGVTYRGEIMIDKLTFEKKYSKEFKNPRSFVSGIVNSDWSEDPDYLSKVKDLTLLVYDYRVNDNGTFRDREFTSLRRAVAKHKIWLASHIEAYLTTFRLRRLYDYFESYRKSTIWPLDGFVIKPIKRFRRNNLDQPYPDDCVAIKFKPQVAKTKVKAIEWNLGKTGEYYPVLILEPIILDGKTIERVSAHNFGYILEHRISPGSLLEISLAGDIIPFIYKILRTSGQPYELPKPCRIEGCHIYGILSKEDTRKKNFLASVDILKIPGFGPSIALQLYEALEPLHILYVSPKDISQTIGGTLGEKLKTNFIQFLTNITLSQIIQSMNLSSCGKKLSDQIAKKILGKPYSYKGLPAAAADWVYTESAVYQRLLRLVKLSGKSLDTFKALETVHKDTILVVLTGKPTKYKNKADFLKANPTYEETTSWSEAKILFTGDVNSTSNKMQRAKKLGIEIRTY